MKHNLKKKYKWKRRGMHFIELNIFEASLDMLKKQVLRPCVLSGQWSKNIRHELEARTSASGESAVDEKKGTTIPFNTIKINKQ